MGKPIELYWMRGGGRRSADLKNFGDWLSKDVVEFVSNREVVWAPAKQADLLAIGSVAMRINKIPFYRLKPLYIWGTGSFGRKLKPFRNLQVTAARGKLSREILGAADDTPLGDPGLFAREIWSPAKTSRKVGLMLNEIEQEYASLIPDRFDILSPMGEPREVIRKLSGFDFIVSSSLHGLVIADSYGIPSRWLKIGLDDFKFLDYYSAFPGRKVLPPASLKDLQTFKEADVETFFNTVNFDMEGMLQGLRAAFPDL